MYKNIYAPMYRYRYIYIYTCMNVYIYKSGDNLVAEA